MIDRRTVLQLIEFWNLRDLSPKPISRGLSGGVVLRGIDAVGSEVAVKRWPTAAKRDFIAQRHAVLGRLRDGGFDLVPAVRIAAATVPDRSGRTVRSIDISGRGTVHWDAVEWLPGQPIPVDASATAIRAGAAAIGRFHAAAVDGLGQRRQPAPAYRDRFERMQTLLADVSRLVAAAKRSFDSDRLIVAMADAADAVAQTVQPVANQIENTAADARRIRLVHWILRDVHREHVLYCESKVTGLIDFDAMRIDTPAADLARWLGSFPSAWRDPDLWRDSVADCVGECSFHRAGGRGESLHHDSRALARLSAWIAAAQWLQWVAVENRSFAADQDRIAARIEHCTTILRAALCSGGPLGAD